GSIAARGRDEGARPGAGLDVAERELGGERRTVRSPCAVTTATLRCAAHHRHITPKVFNLRSYFVSPIHTVNSFSPNPRTSSFPAAGACIPPHSRPVGSKT